MHGILSLSIATLSLVVRAQGLAAPLAGVAMYGGPDSAIIHRRMPFIKDKDIQSTTRTTTTSANKVTTTSRQITTTTQKASTTTTQKSTSAPTIKPTAVSSIESIALKAHNDYRAQHGASALSWNPTLASAAQSWADRCVFEHSKGALQGMIGRSYGENLAAFAGYQTTAQDAVDGWTAESKDYDPANPVYSHFTQVVWKATTEVGCAVAKCSGIFDAKYGLADYYVCDYTPPGNSGGPDEYRKNVQP